MTEQRDSVTAAELDEFNAAYTRQCAREDIEICANGGPCGCAQAAFLSASATLRRELADAQDKHTILSDAHADRLHDLTEALRRYGKHDMACAIDHDRDGCTCGFEAALAPAAQGGVPYNAAEQEFWETFLARTQPAPAPSAGETVLVPKAIVDELCSWDHCWPGNINLEYVIGRLRRAAAAPTTGETVLSKMAAALLHVRSIISEAALTGFNCHDGNWSERLFASQQITYAALAPAAQVSETTFPTAREIERARLAAKSPAKAPAPSAGETRAAIIEELDGLASDMSYEANQTMDQETADRARLIYRAAQALVAAAPTTGEPT